MSSDLPPVERLQAVDVEPGDVIVATVDRYVTDAQAYAIKARLQEAFPDHQIVVTCGLDLTVHRPT